MLDRSPPAESLSGAAALILRVPQDADATAVFYMVGRARIQAFLRRRLPWASRESIEDWASDTLIAVLPHASQCRATSEAGVTAWLCSAAWRTVLTDWRSHPDHAVAWSFKRGFDRASSAEYGVCVDRIAVEADSVATDDDDCSIAMLIARIVVDAQRILPDEVQELLYRRIIGRERWQGLAAWTGTSPSACKRRYQRAQERLRQQVIHDISELDEPTRTRAIEWLARCGAVNTEYGARDHRVP